MPSPILFASVGDISDEADRMDDNDLCEELLRVATYSSEKFATPLHVCAVHVHTDNINSLLTSHAHLLYPCDTPHTSSNHSPCHNHPTSWLNALHIVD
ncbi:hypothetical protein DEU56DRAFT_803583 [Suillus clintonianus]|uniref:uncharacterized protein n=1 Tax=Suillus clintonianus TaxID=1904413 RepID=UPI001B88687B|nr:uncharacterized protein DEU56DRAFT_803583 [Suillus clintonianus]KAG2138028.1 hypothetical protein DEU56DRAFT_803583 [Suillus clintonianus]